MGLAVMIWLAIAARCKRCSRTLTARSTRACALGTSSPSHPGRRRAQPCRHPRVAEVLELVGLRRDSAALYPHEFSGGQRQRIAIARALVTYPKSSFSTNRSGLDVSIRAQILNLLKGLQERLQLAYVMIAHDLAAARYLSTRLTVMYAGQSGGNGGVMRYTRRRSIPIHRPYCRRHFPCTPRCDDSV